jgi:hypothetical protein
LAATVRRLAVCGLLECGGYTYEEMAKFFKVGISTVGRDVRYILGTRPWCCSTCGSLRIPNLVERFEAAEERRQRSSGSAEAES